MGFLAGERLIGNEALNQDHLQGFSDKGQMIPDGLNGQ